MENMFQAATVQTCNLYTRVEEMQKFSDLKYCTLNR